MAKRSKQLESELRWLRKAFPSDCRVYVKIVPRYQVRKSTDPPEYKGSDGIVLPFEKSLRILIAEESSEEMKSITLDHEWAHVLAYPKQNRKHHTRDWQLAYGAIAAAREKRLRNP